MSTSLLSNQIMVIGEQIIGLLGDIMKRSLSIFILMGSFLFGSDVVIELLVRDHENNFWQTNNKMHMTIGHIKEVEADKLIESIEVFNKENCELLNNTVGKGFVVEYFNINGFNNGYHILEADQETTERFSKINTLLYEFLIEHHFGALTDKTTPKLINPKGYTPHIEFLESSPDKIPVKGDVFLFKENRLEYKVLKS